MSVAATHYVTDFSDNYSSKSLRGAISQASSGDEIIIKGSGRITLTLGQIYISNKSLIIRALSPDAVIIDANGNSRIFYFRTTSYKKITLKNLSFVNGKVKASHADAGAAILARSFNSDKTSLLSIENCQFINNIAERYNYEATPMGGAITSSFSLDVSDSDFYFNQAIDGTGAAIHADALDNSNLASRVTIKNSNFIGNSAGTGGAVYIPPNVDYASFSSVQFRNNFASVGGAMMAINKELAISNSKFIGNRASLQAGAIYLGNEIDVDIKTTEFDDNYADRVGGALISYSVGKIKIAHSSFGNNRSDYVGGAIDVYGDSVDMTIENTTISGNSAVRGAAIYVPNDTNPRILLNHVTLANNNSNSGGALVGNSSSANFTLLNTILANNNPSDCSAGVIIRGDNIITNTSYCNIIQVWYYPSNLIFADPGLQSFGYYGGNTKTHPIGAGSSAHNAGVIECDLRYDQRYISRDSLCDIGAYEFKFRNPIP